MAHVIHSVPRMLGEANLAQAQTKVQLGCVKYSADWAIGKELYIALLTSLTKAEKGNTQVNNRGKVFLFSVPPQFCFSLTHHLLNFLFCANGPVINTSYQCFNTFRPIINGLRNEKQVLNESYRLMNNEQ